MNSILKLYFSRLRRTQRGRPNNPKRLKRRKKEVPVAKPKRRFVVHILKRHCNVLIFDNYFNVEVVKRKSA